MAVDVTIPTLGESVNEGVIARWIKAEGDAVDADEALFELETDKASVEVPSPEAGVLRILRQEGETVQVGDVVARIEDGAGAKRGADEADTDQKQAKASAPKSDDARDESATEPEASPPKKSGAPAAQPEPALSPAVRRLVAEHDLDPDAIRGTGRGGRITKGDVLAHLDEAGAPPVERSAQAGARHEPPPSASKERADTSGDDVERVPMSRIRQRIAERLVEAQRTAAILTTFNEVDMSAVLELRARHKENFAKAHGVRLGFVSFFARACIAALGDLPIVNAQIDGTEIVRHKRVHLGIAVGTERGLVVPVVRSADRLSFADLEREIARLADKARENRLAIDDLSGGTFTISNGGVYGSLLSTPILNPPQSAILGMHKIERRPVVIDDTIVVRPMMYVALSYDHRLIDGAEAVTFLVRVKERIEDPSRLLLEV